MAGTFFDISWCATARHSRGKNDLQAKWKKKEVTDDERHRWRKILNKGAKYRTEPFCIDVETWSHWPPANTRTLEEEEEKEQELESKLTDRLFAKADQHKIAVMMTVSHLQITQLITCGLRCFLCHIRRQSNKISQEQNGTIESSVNWFATGLEKAKNPRFFGKRF